MILTAGKGDNDLGIEIECVVVLEPVDDVDSLRLCIEPMGGFIAVDDSGVDVPIDEETIDSCVATGVYSKGSFVGVDPFADCNCELALALVPVLDVDIGAFAGVGNEAAEG
ncbi:unnamed protein product [[Candida] boidinii]|nr:unnamed protein product [[Candida] boidinii]